MRTTAETRFNDVTVIIFDIHRDDTIAKNVGICRKRENTNCFYCVSMNVMDVHVLCAIWCLVNKSKYGKGVEKTKLLGN